METEPRPARWAYGTRQVLWLRMNSENCGSVCGIATGSVGAAVRANRPSRRGWHGLRLYATDEVMSDHAGRSTAEEAPFLHQLLAISMDERWVHRSPRLWLKETPRLDAPRSDEIGRLKPPVGSGRGSTDPPEVFSSRS